MRGAADVAREAEAGKRLPGDPVASGRARRDRSGADRRAAGVEAGRYDAVAAPPRVEHPDGRDEA